MAESGDNDLQCQRIMVLGAGASLLAEAGMPLFGRIRANVLARAGLSSILRDVKDSQIESLASYLAPEALLLLLERGGVDATSVITELFNCCAPCPNLVHDLAAHVVSTGGTVGPPTTTRSSRRRQPGRQVAA